MSPANALDRLNADELRLACANQRIGNCVQVVTETTSTNDLVLQMAAEHEEGLVVFAERQTAGRGQYGNRWESAAHKGLWLSILLRPKGPLADASRLTTWAAQTVADTIQEHLSLNATIKSPNDVYLGERKVAGVLLEMRAVDEAPHVGILGIGINVNQTSEDFPGVIKLKADSLAMAIGRRVDRQQLALALLQRLDRTYRVFAL
ncbi:MAG: biotin--[acetyl-CoA-carboxylase] ligase [Chthoniobacterales bacterium]|nr:biotin--[acetyl-CoA-carboxylase] ligase [Chthoniobacterales bacterium]MDQ3120136.1 biotin--[acetyl-CoA-carboxylase] ligase [Verrucomicrobiota bacterium]